MATSQKRINIPRQPEPLLKLAEMIARRDAELGENSPLRLLQWPDKTTIIQEALTLHRQAESLRRQMEQAYEQRDRHLSEVNEWVRQSRDILKGTYRQEIKKLGEFGFEVDSARSVNRSAEP
ncbi:MAG: hypothetical protein HC924_18305 [Synechococcaceae cyanobacterium SM2_3_2]|nr:hypothetical protein [Synechococcaceae cyanobacterium SM2_3_2]